MPERREKFPGVHENLTQRLSMPGGERGTLPGSSEEKKEAVFGR